jgi:hypothetical protein
MSEYEQCSTLFSAELEILARISEAQTLVHGAVQHKEWVDFNTVIDSMKALSASLEELELERIALFERMETGGAGAVSEVTRFYDFAATLPADERKHVTGLFRQLKLESAKVRFASDALSAYLYEAKTLIAGLLEAAFPEKRGKLYGRAGAPRQADMRSIVFNVEG